MNRIVRANVVGIAMFLLAACGGGGGGGGGNGGTAPPPTGPGDTRAYFPTAAGNTWYYDITGSDANGNQVSDLGKFSVAGTKTLLGQLATVQDGTPDSGGFPITIGAGGSAVSVTLAFAGSEYWVAWVSTPAIGVYEGIFGARVGVDGVVKSPGSSGLRMSAKSASFYPAIAANSAGGLLVWLNQSGANVPNSLGGLSLSPFGP